jgi:hypothetical protein
MSSGLPKGDILLNAALLKLIAVTGDVPSIVKIG